MRVYSRGSLVSSKGSGPSRGTIWKRRAFFGGLALAMLASAAVVAQQTQFLGLKVLSNGDVGIGTMDPKATLHVNGNTIVNGVIQGQDNNGVYGNAAVIQGHAASGAAQSPFVILYNDTSPHQPPQIMLVNTATNVFKSFVIANPTDPSRLLVHADLEGPEGAVYYRGSAQLKNGSAVVALPHYFEALTRAEGRTILLTNIDGFDQLAVLLQKGRKIKDGRFIVVSNNPKSAQAFDWEVKAVRADGPPLAVEPLRSETTVGGFGPYAFIVPHR
jgi:hypothetical protein